MTTARSRSLGSEVRNLRKDAGLRLEELAEQCGWSRATLGRVEAGNKVPTETEIAIILATLGVKGPERTRLLELCQNAHQPHWWEVGHSAVPEQLVALMEFERTATKITDIELALVPGLMQTADYAREIFTAAGIHGAGLESRVALRLGRQAALTRREPVSFYAFIDESVLHRTIGDNVVMADQLRHLIRVARRDNVTVQVLPFAAGTHPGLFGSQMILEFHRQRPIVHMEHRQSGVFLDDRSETSPFLDSLPTLEKEGMSPDDSLEFIAERAGILEGAR